MKLLVINGPNLNMLGIREPDVYGKTTYDELVIDISNYAKSKNIEIDFYQSNIEGEIVSKIQQTNNIYDGIIINPAAYSHYSIAILDALKSVNTKAVEVHISNIYKREDFRKKSVTAAGCKAVLSGFGINGYKMAIDSFIFD